MSEFFILRYRNILINTHRTERMFAIRNLYHRGGKATPQEFTSYLGGLGCGVIKKKNYKLKKKMFIQTYIFFLVF